MEPAQEHHELSNKREYSGERSRAQQAHRGLIKNSRKLVWRDSGRTLIHNSSGIRRVQLDGTQNLAENLQIHVKCCRFVWRPGLRAACCASASDAIDNATTPITDEQHIAVLPVKIMAPPVVFRCLFKRQKVAEPLSELSLCFADHQVVTVAIADHDANR